MFDGVVFILDLGLPSAFLENLQFLVCGCLRLAEIIFVSKRFEAGSVQASKYNAADLIAKNDPKFSPCLRGKHAIKAECDIKKSTRK